MTVLLNEAAQLGAVRCGRLQRTAGSLPGRDGRRTPERRGVSQRPWREGVPSG